MYKKNVLPISRNPLEIGSVPFPEFNQEYWKKWVRRKTWPKALPSSPTIRIVDLFCGCGGMTLGVMEAAAAQGYNCSIAFAADTSSAASEVYTKNFRPFLQSYSKEDLSKTFPSDGLFTDANDVRNRYGPIDILVAGPPCQGHSNLNNSTRRNDPRNQLYLSAITAVEVFRPEISIIENVPTVIHDTSDVVKNSHNRLVKAGYGVAQFVIHMEEMGLAQRRRRHILIAAKGWDPAVLATLSYKRTDPPNLKDFIDDLASEWKHSSAIFDTPSSMSSENLRRLELIMKENIFDLPNSARPPCHRDKVHSYKSAYGRLSWDLPAQTITSGFGSMGQGRYIHPSEARTITPHEAARIQGFPDFFDFTSLKKRTVLQEIIANAVPPPAMATIVRSLLKNTTKKMISQ